MQLAAKSHDAGQLCATHSRLEGALRRSDIYRMTRALVMQFIAGYSCAPAGITLDLDHTDDATYGQRPLSFYNHHYGHYCYLPLLVFEAGKGALVTAVLRGDGHFANPELMELIVADGNADFIFGLGGNAALSRKAEGLMKNARGHLALHRSLAAQGLGPAVAVVRLFGEFEYATKSWPQAFRVVLEAEVLPGSGGVPDKDNERFVVTSMRPPSPRTLYRQEYCARGQAEGWIKQVKCDLKSDRTSAQSFIANFGRLLFAAGAYVLHQQLLQLGLQGTALATAQPKTVILQLFKIAVRVKQYKDLGCCICPVPARSKRCWRQSASGSTHPTAGCAPCWLPHEPARLTHETIPPIFFYNRFTLHPACRGWGSVARKSKKLFRDRDKCSAENLCNIQARLRLHATRHAWRTTKKRDPFHQNPA